MKMDYDLDCGYSFMRRSRIAALQILYQYEFYIGEKSLTSISLDLYKLYAAEFTDIAANKDILNEEFINKIIEFAVQNKKIILEKLEPLLKVSWTLDELSLNIKLILFLAFAEASLTDTDMAIIINEYIELAKIFENSNDAKFVNSVVESLVKDIRKNG
jgi:N utilization substance protein B